jgi:hypothetical protein
MQTHTSASSVISFPNPPVHAVGGDDFVRLITCFHVRSMMHPSTALEPHCRTSEHAKHSVPLAAEYDPLEHLMHAREDEEAVSLPTDPVLQDVQESEPFVSLYFPASHSVQKLISQTRKHGDEAYGHVVVKQIV